MTVVAVAQVGSVTFDADATVDKAVAHIAEAAAAGARVVVFPEAFVGTYPKALSFGSPVGRRTEEGRDEFLRSWRAAVEIDGPEIGRLADAARAHDVFVVTGIIERAGRTMYCTIVMIDESGAVVGAHRKVMPTGSERLIWGFGDGSTLPVVDSPAGKLGSVVCWENYMPLLRTAMYAQGVEIYCAPTADDRDTWLPSMQHIALEGRCYVLTACQVMRRSDYPDDYAATFATEPDDVVMRGGSAIVSPRGEVLAGPLFDEEAILYADVDLSEIVRQSLDFDVTGHYARPDLFSLHVDTAPAAAVRFVDDTALDVSADTDGSRA
ncbi:carbon-nitrogen hydrolase family protein [Rhodococcus rhodnii]|uniref:Nitrilase n=2 Tax=Rhodococcus rhodnii TaxID=38312 RepID=R7WQH8_9NOCA|nr:carbon-nitrogen hydrolase family protein [Rhodococcus rhodnii]EOM77576.1 nitrilase [Rhodococcus rhodnii LMG 5362]TXG89208.1 carbon-nitrogen hydrolase family protein [Rhodococcus rhodnii]